MTSRKVPLQNGHCQMLSYMTDRKAQMERQKTQVMQKQICLQMYLLTASWQDLLFTILCKESECNQPPSPQTHTHTLNLED